MKNNVADAKVHPATIVADSIKTTTGEFIVTPTGAWQQLPFRRVRVVAVNYMHLPLRAVVIPDTCCGYYR